MVVIAFRPVESTVADGFGVYIAGIGDLLSIQVVKSCDTGSLSVK